MSGNSYGMVTEIETFRRVQKLIFILGLMLVFASCSHAELDLANTSWEGAYAGDPQKKISLHFTGNRLVIVSNPGKDLGVRSAFSQSEYMVSFSDWSGLPGCSSSTRGLYKIGYANSGQTLSFKLINDSCGPRVDIFGALLPLNFVPDENGAPRNWSHLDARDGVAAGIALNGAYQVLKGKASRQIIVAVIDNGVDITHEDLKSVIWTNTKEIPDNGIDDDKNGYVDDIHGWNFRGTKNGTVIENEHSAATQVYLALRDRYDKCEPARLRTSERRKCLIYIKAKNVYLDRVKNSHDENDVKFAYNPDYDSTKLIEGDSPDPHNRVYGSPKTLLSENLSHGTHVAGIIAAKRDNQIGIDGIANNVLIMPIVASTAVGDERDKDVANAIRYAVANGARVINISFSKVFSPEKPLVDAAIRYAEQNNVLIVHCAGNDGVDIDKYENYHYPVAIFDSGRKASNFITVGWSRSKFDHRLGHPSSGYGKTNVDVFAPGSDIFSTVPGSSYAFKSGSSMSAPMVSGFAALLLSYFPTLSTFQVKQIIRSSCFVPTTMVDRPGSRETVKFSSLSASGGIINILNGVRLAISITNHKPPRPFH